MGDNSKRLMINLRLHGEDKRNMKNPMTSNGTTLVRAKLAVGGKRHRD